MIGGCGLVAMSYWLGASWLAEPLIGLPLGVWLAGAATGVSHILAVRRELDLAARSGGGSSGTPHTSGDHLTTERIGCEAPGLSGFAASLTGAGEEIGNVWMVGVNPAGAAPAQRVNGRVGRRPDDAGGTPIFEAPPEVAAPSTAPPPAPAYAFSVEPASESLRSRVNKGLAAIWPTGAVRFGRRFVESPREAVRHAREIVGSPAGPALGPPGPARIRIGIQASARETSALIDLACSDSVPGARVEWTPIALSTDAGDPAALRLDAVIRRGRHDDIIVRVPEHADHPAAWPDWCERLPLGYAGVFPTRVDPVAVSCGVVDLTSERDARLVSRLAEVAGFLGRHDARLWPTSRDGRGPIRDLFAAGGAVERSMLRLSNTLAADWTTPAARTEVGARAAARAAGAWLASWDEMDSKERRRLVEACADILEGEPEATLRVAAACIGAGETQRGLERLGAGFGALVAQGQKVAADPLAFVHAEIEYGPASLLTLGRAAAGLCVLWAGSNQQSLDYLRDDLLDELRFASRFIGQDQDHLLLREVIRHMDRIRSQMLPLASAAA